MRALLLGLVTFVATACNQEFGVPGAGDDMPPGPGNEAWDDTDLSCQATADCAPGETCDGGTCRPKQCDDGPYESATPLGARRVFFREQELLVADSTANEGAFWVDGYDAGSSVSYSGPGGGSYSISSAAIVDLAPVETADGNGFVVANQGTSRVRVTGRRFAAFEVETGLRPVAVAAADVDGDGQADLVAISSTGEIAVCQLGGGCTSYNFGTAGVTAKDVTTGDLDGDGTSEIIFLLRVGDATEVITWKLDGDTVGASFSVHFDAVTAGDFDRDGRAELALLEDRGWFGFASDQIHVYRVGAQFTGIGAFGTTGSAVDLAAGDIDGNDGGEALAVLGDNRGIDVLRWNGSGLAKVFSGSATATTAPRRIALGDVDDDSVSARLVSGPELVPGKLVPTVVVTFPPYLENLANAGEAGVAIGRREDVSEDAGQTVSLQAGVEVGVDADFVGLFKAKLSTKLSKEVTRSRSLGTKHSVGMKFSLKPQPELYGNHYAAVVVACNCFHTYEYQLEDSANRAGGDGRRLIMVVPVGGQTTVLSTPRYGALQAALPELPSIAVGTTIGDPTSYAKSPTKLDGSAVQPDEHVFPSRPTLRVSDVGTVAFSMSVGQTETNAVAMKTSLSVQGSITAAGVMFGASLGASWGQSYSVTVGETAEFSGDVPPIPDDPATPEDEYQTHAFSYSPFVYRQGYTDAAGETAGFYVLDYAVGAP